MRSPTRGALLLALTAIGLVSAPIGAASAAAPATAAAPADAYLRGAHFSPDTGGVDVYLTSFAGGTTTLWLANVGYGDVSQYEQLPAGDYAVSMRPHGAAASTPAALTWTLDAQAGQAYTAAAIGMNAQLHGIVLTDQLAPPSPGTGQVRVIQASSQAGTATVTAANGPTIAAHTAFGTTTSYTTVPAGKWQVSATSDTDASLTASAGVTVTSGSITSIVVLDGQGGGLVVRSVLDAAGVVTSPGGSVNAGGGGTAVRPSESVQIRWLAVLIIVAALVGEQSLRVRRRLRRA